MDKVTGLDMSEYAKKSWEKMTDEERDAQYKTIFEGRQTQFTVRNAMAKLSEEEYKVLLDTIKVFIKDFVPTYCWDDCEEMLDELL